MVVQTISAHSKDHERIVAGGPEVPRIVGPGVPCTEGRHTVARGVAGDTLVPVM